MTLKLLIALVFGALLTAAFAPLNWWPVAFISPAVLIALWQNATAKQAAWMGYLFGFGFFGIGVSWVYNSIHEFGHAPAPFAVGLTILFVLVLSFFPAITGYAQASGSINRKQNNASNLARYLFLLPAIWVICEWLRGWLFTGFPWLQLGYSQLSTPFSNLAPVAGVLSVSWVMMIWMGCGFLVWKSTGSQRLVAMLAVVVLPLALFALGKVTWTVPLSTDGEDDVLDVRLVQGNIAQENKWEQSWLVPTIDLYVGLSEENLDADLIVWPEVALPGRYALFEDTVLKPLQKKLVTSETDLLLGVLRKTENGLYNALLQIGEKQAFYLKRHLVPFGEYIPFRNSLSWLKDMVQLPSSDLSSGTIANTLKVGKYQAGGSICYEDAYGVEVSDMLPDANFLVNVSNDAWFGDSLAPHQHLQIAQMRALETGRPLLRTTNTGISAVITHKGAIQSIAPQFHQYVLKDTIKPRTGQTPYVMWRDKLILLLASILLVWGYVKVSKTAQ